MSTPAGSPPAGMTPEALALPDPGEHIPYRIVSQQQREELVPPNQFVDYWEVTYEGPSGTIATVKIPVREYSMASVNEAIQQQLLTTEQVHALGPLPPPEE